MSILYNPDCYNTFELKLDISSLRNEPKTFFIASITFSYNPITSIINVWYTRPMEVTVGTLYLTVLPQYLFFYYMFFLLKTQSSNIHKTNHPHSTVLLPLNASLLLYLYHANYSLSFKRIVSPPVFLQKVSLSLGVFILVSISI